MTVEISTNVYEELRKNPPVPYYVLTASKHLII